MVHIERITDADDRLIGFEFDGELIAIRRDQYKSESQALRGLANEIMNRLINLPGIKLPDRGITGQDIADTRPDFTIHNP